MLIIEQLAEVEANVDHLWSIVADPFQQERYVAYDIHRVEQRRPCDIGPQFEWRESGVLLGKRYEAECKMLGWEPKQWLCFGSQNLFHVSFEMTEASSGCAVRYRVELPQTAEQHRGALEKVCRQTLSRLKRLAEQGAIGESDD